MDSKDPDIHVLDRWMPQQNQTEHAPSTKTECDYLYGLIINGQIRENLTQYGEAPEI